MRAWKSHHHGEGTVAGVGVNELARLHADEMVHRQFPRKTADDGSLIFEVAIMFIAVVLSMAVLSQEVKVIVS